MEKVIEKLSLIRIKNGNKYKTLEKDLRKARLKVFPEVYISFVLTSFIISFIILYIIFAIIFFLTKNIIALILPSIISLLIFLFLYFYPKLKAIDIQRDIDNNIVYTTIYLSSIFTGGIPPAAVFKILSRKKEFGEISIEAREILKHVELLGISFIDALKRQSEITPSKKLSELLSGIASSISAGGDTAGYLREVANAFINEERNLWRERIDKLSIFLEIYITLLIIGPIFIGLTGSLLSGIAISPGFNPLAMIQLMVYIAMPLINLMFLIIIHTMFPTPS